ncbi:DUF4190 domain-containing protein [Arthrobacter sp. PsM3]|uniref:DUF4190 domain-containing protein n=1 Tax=Arthrobacter sp. PsM3 TaxID=3030531 RepID=UPI00263B0E96|nr:DUF4190 domain-containing protein [Arthrobacter sp. PsM3]MDN4643795.1 DUF4190 domain-containing protein [Arthrobacter sp. PsM3]
MTDQPKPEHDGTPEGYQPPSYIPAQESDVPAPPKAPSWPATAKIEQPGYGQQPYGTPGQSGEQSGQPAAGYGQPASEYSQPAAGYGQPADAGGTPYGAAPQQPYGAPPQYGQPGSPFNAYGQPSYYGVPPEPRGLSIASLCCGIAAFVGLGIFLLPQLAAVILGHLALKREPSGRGMAIAGLVLGYVGIALTILVVVIIALGLAISSSSYRGYGA